MSINEPINEEHIMIFNEVLNAILIEICDSVTSEQIRERLDELVDFLDDNQEIIQVVDEDNLYEYLENVFIQWYQEGMDEVEDYYETLFGQEFPNWIDDDDEYEEFEFPVVDLQLVASYSPAA
jgi:hypothetical protein